MFTMDTKITNFLVNYLDDIIIRSFEMFNKKHVKAKA